MRTCPIGKEEMKVRIDKEDDALYFELDDVEIVEKKSNLGLSSILIAMAG
jgi:hypothetical protein